MAPKLKNKDGLLLHVWTRYLREHLGPVSGHTEDWVELPVADCAKLVPPKDATVGSSWEVPPETANKLYRYFYPPSQAYDAEQGTVHRSSLTATVSAVSPSEIQVMLHGNLDFTKHGNLREGMGGRIHAQPVGVVRIDPRTRTLTSFQMVVPDAQHTVGPGRQLMFGIAVEKTAPGTEVGLPAPGQGAAK